MERRQHKRLPCRIPCDIHLGKKKSVAGFVQDLSAGGLSVRADLDVDEDATFAVTLKVAPRSLVLECMVWHVRKVHRPASGEHFMQLGLVLTEPSSGFLDLLGRLEQRVRKPKKSTAAARRPESKPITKPAPTQVEPEPEAKPVAPPVAVLQPARGDAPSPVEESRKSATHSFAVHVKQNGGPRSRRLVVGGSSAKDAEQRALAEIGSGWTILDVKPV